MTYIRTKPRAVQNGMSQAEYDAWMFLADKKALESSYTYEISSRDMIKFIESQHNAWLDEMKKTINGLNIPDKYNIHEKCEHVTNNDWAWGYNDGHFDTKDALLDELLNNYTP